MELWVALLLLGAWLALGLVVAGLCRAARLGDGAHERLRSAHWHDLER